MGSKTKRKASYIEVLKLGPKAGGSATSIFNKGGKIYRSKQAVSGKTKSSYGSHAPSTLQLHEAAQAVELADASAGALEGTGLEYETELADKLVTEVAGSSADVKELCEAYRLKREELGRLTGFSLRALAEWAAGKLPSQPAKRRLQEVRRLLDALAEIVKRGSIPNWLHQRNAAFGGLTPLQVIELGEIDRLWAMVHEMGSGQPE